jgi:hypothetical protein
VSHERCFERNGPDASQRIENSCASRQKVTDDPMTQRRL